MNENIWKPIQDDHEPHFNRFIFLTNGFKLQKFSGAKKIYNYIKLALFHAVKYNFFFGRNCKV